MNYLIPAEINRTETAVSNSRFLSTAGHVQSVEEARQFIASIKDEMPDASHHVYAFRIGYGNSVTEGVSDDGEPSGTSGPPVLAVLRGTQIGDVIVVVSRYFGGTKLGTGGLVRAYSEAARTVLASLKTTLNIKKQIIGLECSYALYERIRRLVSQHEGEMTEEAFAENVTMMVNFPLNQIAVFEAELRELTAGRVVPVILE